MDVVQLVEVGPRDGLQNIKKMIPTKLKKQFIDLLVSANLTRIEITSFVDPNTIPQLSDAAELSKIISPTKNVEYECLIPNLIGFKNAAAFCYKTFSFFTSPSEAFCYHNINCNTDESLSRFEEIRHNMQPQQKSRVYLSCLWGCPYEGKISINQTMAMIDSLLQAGAEEISLGDTLGMAKPSQTKELLNAIASGYDLSLFAVHFHNTSGQAIANIDQALTQGVRIIDTAAGGLGGCPFAPGAQGNVATEQVATFLKNNGIDLLLDLDKIAAAVKLINDHPSF